jgi:hypothetical protein
MRLRRLIAGKLPSCELSGAVEADESYFGGIRKGKRGGGASGKVAVFGLLKGVGKIVTAIVPNVRTETLLPIILAGGTKLGFQHGQHIDFNLTKDFKGCDKHPSIYHSAVNNGTVSEV